MGVLTLALAFCVSGLAQEAENEGPTEVDVARATASLLERGQFSRRPLDARLSSQFLDGYLDALDGAHLLFLQCDLDEFDRFRPDLAQMTLREGGTQPAHLMYARYLKRLAQQVSFETNLLRTERFTFSGDDSWQADRHGEPPPRDLAAAQELWRGEVREGYLREELAATPAEEIAPMLARRYEGLLQTMRRLDTNQVLGIYLDALAHVYDPHSDYFGREDLENFNIETKLSLAGIGGTLQTKGGYSIIGLGKIRFGQLKHFVRQIDAKDRLSAPRLSRATPGYGQCRNRFPQRFLQCARSATPIPSCAWAPRCAQTANHRRG